MANFSQLTKEIENVSSELESPDAGITPQERQKLLTAARDMVDKLEGPLVGIWKVLFGPQGNAALKAAYRMRIFEVFEGQETAQQLAEKTGADKVLVVRIMRVLTRLGIFNEVGEELYTHNMRSKIISDPIFRTRSRAMEVFHQYMHKLEDYLESISFKNPEDQDQNLFQYAMQTKMNFFDWLHTQPREFESFSNAMAANTKMNLNAVVDNISMIFPEEIDTASDETLIIDVGGGRGKILDTFRQMRPGLKGRMIVQDLPGEIKGREPCDGVEAMAHDFFTPQPVKDAHVYFFRHVFHDWSDNVCREILKHTISAMKKGHSRLVIADAVLPNTDASVLSSFLDIGMMTVSGMERTERHWRELLTGAGLTIEKIGGTVQENMIQAILS